MMTLAWVQIAFGLRVGVAHARLRALMQQDESALVREAKQHAAASLARGGRVPMAAYMLVRRNPQTGAPLTHATALGAELPQPIASRKDYLEILGVLRAEARRLDAMAIALCGEADAEIEEHGTLALRRVFFVRIEDREGVHHLHAAIESSADGQRQLGQLLASSGAQDDVDQPLLPTVR